MSSRPAKSNDEIVEELTKNLEHDLKMNGSVNKNTTFESVEDDGTESDFEVTSDETLDETAETDNEEINDLVDEEHLKELEESLTDEEKETRKLQALEFKERGNEEFRQKKFSESVKSYTEALRFCPLKYSKERSIFYANRAASKLNIGFKKSAIQDCSKSIELNDQYVRAYLRRAKLYEEENKLDESLEDFKKVLDMDSQCREAIEACIRLPPLIEKRNEELKTEMFGKLKQLGDLILTPFGLSTDNFQLQQNPETGGYSVNFKQNKG